MFTLNALRRFRATTRTPAARGRTAVRAAAAAVPFETLESRQMMSAGSLDASFGTGGKVVTGMGANDDTASAVYVDVYGRTLVAGSSAGNMVLARYNKNGTLDKSFGGGDGKVTIDFGGHDYAAAVTGDYGHVTVVGRTDVLGADRFAVARLTDDGSPDNSFDGDGRKVFNFAHDTGYGGGPTAAYASQAVGVQNRTDGKIVVGGSAYIGVPQAGQTDSVLALARLNPDGSFDGTFGTAGQVTREFSYHNAFDHQEATAMAVMPDGRIVLGGRSNYSFGVARFLPNGNSDNSFGNVGYVTTDLAGGYEVISSLAVGPNNTLVAGGSSSLGVSKFSATLVKYDVNGNLDKSFSGDGVMYTPLGQAEINVGAVAVQADGRILAASSGIVLGNTADVVVTRLNPNGSKDAGFGFGGFSVIDFGGGTDHAAGVGIGAGGKVTVAGTKYLNGNRDFEVARVHGHVPTFTITKVKDAIEGKQDGVFKVERDGDPYGFDPVTIRFDVLGNAKLGADFTLTPSIAQNGLTFMTGQSTMLVTVHAVADGKTEGIETATLMFKPDGAYETANDYAYALITDK